MREQEAIEIKLDELLSEARRVLTELRVQESDSPETALVLGKAQMLHWFDDTSIQPTNLSMFVEYHTILKAFREAPLKIGAYRIKMERDYDGQHYWTVVRGVAINRHDDTVRVPTGFTLESMMEQIQAILPTAQNYQAMDGGVSCENNYTYGMRLWIVSFNF